MTVLLAYIHRPDGDAALAAAVDEARRRERKAVVVNVTQPAADDSPKSEEQELDAVAALFAGAGVEAQVRQLPATPDRAAAILAVMAETKPELVVIGMRKRNPVGEFIIGSTSHRLIRAAECPVLVVKAPAG